MTRRVYGSLTRISDLATAAYDLQRIDRSQWATGDYIEAEVIPPISKLYHVEDQTGFMDPVKPGDHLVGAHSRRATARKAHRRYANTTQRMAVKACGAVSLLAGEIGQIGRNPGAAHSEQADQNNAYHHRIVPRVARQARNRSDIAV